ncbi:MAG: thiamine phosphate synthase [Bacteroidetes bacterium]|nr:thiamine phosphate synthase [Bacteroidota bacterium]
MKLVVISSAKDHPDERILVAKMFESGLTTFHLRKPKYSTNQMREYIMDIPEHFHNRIVIHSHHQLALKFNLKGVHFTTTHLSKKWKYWFVRQRLKLKLGTISKSRSYSRLPQVYNSEEYNFTYYLLGTMFNSLTGALYSGFYEEGLIAAIKNTHKNFVARGGTTPQSVKKANDLGFYGIAFNSYLWDAPHPYQHFVKILDAFKADNILLE